MRTAPGTSRATIWPAFAAAAMLLLAVPAAAQSAEAVTAATQLVDTLSPPDVGKARLDQQIRDMRAGAGVRRLLSQNPATRAELAKNSPAIEAGLARLGAIQADALEPILREMHASARSAQIDGYAKAFTAPELQRITAFYKSAEGAKFLQQQGPIATAAARDNAERYAARMRSAEQEAAPRLNAELRKLFPNLIPPAQK